MDPLDSAGRAFAYTRQSRHFKLYARDIMRDPLHARLVTISSATDRVFAPRRRGLVGLSWAFLRAGAHNVIGPCGR